MKYLIFLLAFLFVFSCGGYDPELDEGEQPVIGTALLNIGVTLEGLGYFPAAEIWVFKDTACSDVWEVGDLDPAHVSLDFSRGNRAAVTVQGIDSMVAIHVLSLRSRPGASPVLTGNVGCVEVDSFAPVGQTWVTVVVEN